MNSKVFKASDAAKLESSDRLKWLPPAEVLSAMKPQEGETVADVGAGTGYFALPIAKAVGPSGRVLAVDSQREMLDLLRNKIAADGTVQNVELILGSADGTTLPDGSVDLIFMANVWHEIDDHAAVLQEMRRIIKLSGRLAILDWRADVAQPPGPALGHRISPAAVAETLDRLGWRVSTSSNIGEYSHLVMAKPA